MAGLYEHGPGDVPRIAALPAWNAIAVFDGERWLDSTAAAGAVRELPAGARHADRHRAHQLRLGDRRPAHGRGGRDLRLPGRLAPRRHSARSHAPRERVGCGSGSPSPDGRRRGGCRWPRFPRADPAGGRRTSGIPGTWSCAPARRPRGNRARCSRSPRRPRAAPACWPRPPSRLARRPPRGDRPNRGRRETPPGSRSPSTRVAGRTYTFTQITALRERRATDPSARPSAARRRQRARAAAQASPPRTRGRGAAAGRPTSRSRATPALQRVVRSMLFYLLAQRGLGHGDGHPARWGSPAPGTTATSSGTPTPGCSRRCSSPTPTSPARWSPSGRRTLPAAQANASANGYRGAMYPWEADERGQETTPHFAAQNAKLGDPRQRRRRPGPVAVLPGHRRLRAGSRATGYPGHPGDRQLLGQPRAAATRRAAATTSTTSSRWHEGLIGVSDDAYTNAVARKNLEIAVRGQRAGSARRPIPAGARSPAKLHLPYDSASEFFRTYEGAPDSTLGAVTPLLSYPLGVPMSERAKRAQLEQAVQRLLEEGAGRDDGHHAAVGGRRGAGRPRAGGLAAAPQLPAATCRGPFLMLSETPTNDAVNFVTGAGGFLQQVIFGYTGLRLGRGRPGAGLRPGAAVAREPARPAQRALPGQALRRGRGLDRPADHPAAPRAEAR